MRKKIEKDFTKGIIPKQLAMFMLPFMASNVFQVMYSLVDMAVVGKYIGSGGLSAVSVGGSVTGCATMLCFGFSNGGQIMISQLIGADKRRELPNVIGTLLALTLTLGVLFSVALIVFRAPIAKLLNAPTESLDMTIDYIMICGGGFIFVAGYNAIFSIMRAMGDSRHPFIFISVATVVNIVLDFIFVGAMDMKVAGAALATVIGQATSFACAIILMMRRRGEFYFDFCGGSFAIRPCVLGEIIKFGIPLALQACVINFSMMFVNSFVNLVGVNASATYGVGSKIDDIVNKMTLGVQYASAPMVGQNIGAKNYERVRRVIFWTWAMVGACSLVFVTAYLSFGTEIFALFDSSPETFELAPTFISAMLWTFPAMCLMRGSNSLLQGTGNTVLIMCLSCIDSVLRVALSYLFGITLGYGFYGFVLGFALAPYGVSIPGTIYFISGQWKKRRNYVDRV